MKQKRILIVEDEVIIAFELKVRLEQAGYHVLPIAVNGQQAESLALKERPDLILMDIILKGTIDGVEAAENILQKRNVPIIYLSGNSDRKYDSRLLNTNPVAFLIKPAEDWKLLKTIKYALNSVAIDSH
ncbi:MAG TPA: response regulator [bacterium]|mgnify:CR=1 FL=1|nr:response regulator [bacterium]